MTAELKKNAATCAPDSWKPYPAYKDSGVEWLGEVPKHWEMRKIKHIAKVNLSNVDKKTKEGEDTVKLCNYVDVYYNDYITPDLDFMEATASSDQIDKFALREGDVIITKDSESWEDIAVPAYVPADLKGVICGYHLAHVRPNYSDIYGEYLFWSLCAPLLNHQFRIEAHGITRFGLGKYNLDNSLFLVPPINAQKFIAHFLDDRTRKIDSLIEKKQTMIELLKEERAAVINQAVTKGLNPDAPMKDSGIEWLGEVPEKWEVKRLKHNIDIQSGDGILSENIKESGIYPVYGGNGIMGYTDKYNRDELDIIIGRVGAKCGNVHLVEGFKWVSDNALIIKTQQNYKFMSLLLDVLNLNNLANQNAQPLITGTLIKNQWVILPSVKEQIQIVNFVESQSTKIDRAVSRIEKEITLLQEYRTALISEVVTGKIDVREAI